MDQEQPNPNSEAVLHTEQFVGREKVLDLVTDKANLLLAGQELRNPTTVILSEPGTGKTTFLNELGRQLAKIGFHVVQLDFAIDQKGAPYSPSALWQPISQICVAVETRAPVALFIDNAYDPPKEDLSIVEKFLLSPALDRNALIVLTGSFSTHAWLHPKLRLHANVANLDPFTLETTMAQLAAFNLDTEKIEEIHKLTNGHPLANRLLAEHGVHNGLAKARDMMLADVPRGLHVVLDQISILQSVNTQKIQELVEGFEGFKTARNTALSPLSRAGLLSHDATLGGYILKPNLRQILRANIRVNHYNKWVKLHEAAAALFSAWATKYPRSQCRWTMLAAYHREQSRV